MIQRSVFRELFNNICADFSIYRLNHDIDDEFLAVEKELWECRENALCATQDDLQCFENILEKAQIYLKKRKENTCEADVIN